MWWFFGINSGGARRILGHLWRRQAATASLVSKATVISAGSMSDGDQGGRSQFGGGFPLNSQKNAGFNSGGPRVFNVATSGVSGAAGFANRANPFPPGKPSSSSLFRGYMPRFDTNFPTASTFGFGTNNPSAVQSQFGTGFGVNSVVQSAAPGQGQNMVFGQSVQANNLFNVGSASNNAPQRNGNQGYGGNRNFRRTIFGGRNLNVRMGGNSNGRYFGGAQNLNKADSNSQGGSSGAAVPYPSQSG
jgi:hypothetical protein